MSRPTSNSLVCEPRVDWGVKVVMLVASVKVSLPVPPIRVSILVALKAPVVSVTAFAPVML